MTAMEAISLSAQILVFVGLIFAVLKFAQEKKREFQKRFFEEQLKIYSEAVDSASSISLFDKTEDEYKVAKNNFKRLFWGKMCIVEDKYVEEKMSIFNEILDQYDAENNPSKLNEIKENLQQAGLALAHSCRNSSINTWNIKKLKGFNDYSSLNSETESNANLPESAKELH
jgi:Zn-dependent M32 family carboxypeptidase